MPNKFRSLIEHCDELAKNGETDLASAAFRTVYEGFRDNFHSFIYPKQVLAEMEKVSYRIGVDIAFQYAEYFYKQRDRKAARQWLSKAKRDAKKCRLNIRERIFKLKRLYKDRMPLIF